MRRRLALEVIALLAGAGAIAGFVTAQFLPRRYVSSTVVTFDKPVPARRCALAAAETLSAESLAPLVLESAYYKPELDYTPVADVVRRIEENASIRGIRAGNRDGFRVEFIDADRYAALDVARMLIGEMGRNAGVATRTVGPISAGRTGPSAALCTTVGLCAGIVVGFAIAALAGRVAWA
jgi:hypothetical protein